MSFIQMTVCPSPTNFTFVRPQHNALTAFVSVAPPRTCLLPKISRELGFRMHSKLPNISLRLSNSVLKRQRYSSVCYSSSSNNADKADKSFSWNPLEKGKGIEDVLRQQMQKQEYADDGSGGGSRFGGGSGGGGGGGGDSGDSDDEAMREMLHEFLQVILATAGFIFLYMLIIDGEEITRMTKDILKFIFTRKKSIRLTRTIDHWQNFFEQLGRKEYVDPYWLEREIVRTNTWWDGPSKFKRSPKRRPASEYESYD